MQVENLLRKRGFDEFMVMIINMNNVVACSIFGFN